MISDLINNNYLFVILFLLIIIMIYHYYFNKICNIEPEHYVYGKGDFTILIIGATHGNEPAGYHIIKTLMNKLNIGDMQLQNCKLILVPLVNNCGYKTDSRYNYLLNDINRNYKSNNIINKKIIELSEKADFIIDFHEGWGFHKINKDSLGSSIGLTEFNDTEIIKNKILQNLNVNIQEEIKQFVHIDPKINDFDGTLSQYTKNNNKKYILIELAGQNDVQPMEIRVSQGLNVIDTILNFYNLIK